MQYLIDTHILLWSIIEPSNLSKKVKKILLDSDNEIYVSSVSAWEIAIKHSLGKLNFSNFNPSDLFHYCEELNFNTITIDFQEALNVLKLPEKENHKDPFDRLLISQAITNSFILISKDSKFEQYKTDGLKVVW